MIYQASNCGIIIEEKGQGAGTVDRHGSEPCARKGVRVQIPPLAQRKMRTCWNW